MHIGDLDGSSISAGFRWNASVTATVLDAGGGPVANATVAGTWTYGSRQIADSCITDAVGQCEVTFSDAPGWIPSVSFTIDDVTGALTYNAADNTDPDGDSDGVTIMVSRP